MPSRPSSPCAEPGCPRIAVRNGRCQQHSLAQRRKCDQRRDSPAARGYDSEWRRIRARFLRYNDECVICGAPATDVDHITPLAAGGTNDTDNLAAMCHRCHARKTARRDGGWGNRRAE